MLSACPSYLAGRGYGGELRQTSELAIKVLEAFPYNFRFYLFPNKVITYEIVGDRSDVISGSVSRFLDVKREFSYTNWFGIHPQVSLIIYSSAEINSDLKSALGKSNILPAYKDAVASSSLSSSGCSTFTFESRHVWRSVGILVVDQSLYGDGDASHIDRCVHNALDVFVGFPKRDISNKSIFADSVVRRMIISAMYACSAMGLSDMVNPERSRDGLTAMPPKSCVADVLKRAP